MRNLLPEGAAPRSKAQMSRDSSGLGENPEEAVERFGEGAAPRSRAQLCVADEDPGEGEEAARPQRAAGAARPVPDEDRRERRLFARLYGGWAHGVETQTRADRLAQSGSKRLLTSARASHAFGEGRGAVVFVIYPAYRPALASPREVSRVVAGRR